MFTFTNEIAVPVTSLFVGDVLDTAAGDVTVNFIHSTVTGGFVISGTRIDGRIVESVEFSYAASDVVRLSYLA